MTVVILLLSVYHPLQKSVGCNPKGQSRFSKILRFLGLFLYQLAFLSTKTVRSTAFFLFFFNLHFAILLSCTKLKTEKADSGKLIKDNKETPQKTKTTEEKRKKKTKEKKKTTIIIA